MNEKNFDLAYELRKCTECSCSRCVLCGTKDCYIEEFDGTKLPCGCAVKQLHIDRLTYRIDELNGRIKELTRNDVEPIAKKE